MGEVVEYAIRGIPVGCVFALLAVGIVLTYRVSGVFNLAFGAQAFVSAAVFYDLRSRHDQPLWFAVLVAVVVVGPAIGFLLDRLLYRHLRTAPQLAKLVVSLGLLVAIPQLTKLWFGSAPAFNPPGITGSDAVWRFGAYALDANQIATIVITALVVLGLTLLLGTTDLGLRMRAVVESPRLTELAGINADRVGTVAWMLSSFLAGLAGVLLAPLFAQVSDLNFFALLVAALAAAAFGSLRSIPLTLLGGILLGVLQAELAGFLPTDNVFATGLRGSLPFLVLFVLLLVWPGLRHATETTDPLAGVDPPPPPPSVALRSRALTLATRIGGTAVGVVLLVLAFTTLNDFWVSILVKGVLLALIFCSFVILTGLSGQLSLCQATFAATGAFTTAKLVSESGMSVLVAMVIGAVVAAALGALIALPALRLGGIFLALATLAFALMYESIVRPLEWVSGGSRPPKVPRPLLAGIDFTDDRYFLLLAVAFLALVATGVWLVKRGTTGRVLDALRGSEVGARSIGISPARSKVLAFALSAGIAGFGGGLLASFEGRANYEANYAYVIGLIWVVLVVTLGARSIQAAITGGLAFLLFPQLLQLAGLDQSFANSVSYVLFGLGALTYAKHPEGIVEANANRVLGWIQRSPRPSGEQADDTEPDVAVQMSTVGTDG